MSITTTGFSSLELPQLFEDLESVRGRHRDVEQKQIGLELLAQREDLVRLGGALDRAVAASLEDPDEEAGVLIVVIGDECRDLCALGVLRHTVNFTARRVAKADLDCDSDTADKGIE